MGIFNFKNKTAHKFIKNQSKKAGNLDKIKIEKIENVGIIAEVNLFRSYDFTKKLSEDLGIDKKAIRVILFDDVKNENLIDNYEVYSEKAFSYYGKIKEIKLKEFVNTEFDLLINYCDSNIIYAQITGVKSNAKLKAGFEHNFSNFNDLSIKITGNKIDTFNSELIKYLHIMSLLK